MFYLRCLILLLVAIGLNACGSSKKSSTKNKTSNKTNLSTNQSPNVGEGLKWYANKMDVPISTLKNKQLYAELDKWMGTRYQYGGTTKRGVDCSGFTGAIFSSVYKITIPRTTSALAKKIKTKNKHHLKEGDLVFFNYDARNSHVGIYLNNGWFVHASTSQGVVLSDLKTAHYQKRYSKGGTYIKK